MIKTIDENGTVIDVLADRNEKIKEALAPVLAEFMEEKEKMLAIKKPVQLGGRFSTQLHAELVKYGMMSPEAIANLDYETILDLWTKFSELIAYYNRFFDYSPNIQIFLDFCGWDSGVYERLQKSQDDEIKRLLNKINSDLLGIAYSFVENGNTSASGGTTRIEASGVSGHGVTKAKDEKIIDAIKDAQSPQQMLLEIERINTLGQERKKLTGK